MSNRQDIAFLTPFANDAETTLPGVPIDGTSYRDTTFSDLGPGWPYKTKVESQDFNQIMYIQTLLMRQMSNQGILDYSNKEDYTADNALVKDDGGLYLCVANNGPASTVKQPSAEPLFWRRIDVSKVAPLNNAWNGFFRLSQAKLPSPAGFPATSGAGGTTYNAGDEFTLGWKVLNNSTNVSIDDDGMIFSNDITFETQLDSNTTITSADIRIYVRDDLDNEYWFDDGDTIAISVTGGLITVLFSNAILGAIAGTKMKWCFLLDGGGIVNELSGDKVAEEVNPNKAVAWIVFNGTGSVAILDSFGVDALIDNGTGQYAYTLSEARPSVNFAPLTSGAIGAGLGSFRTSVNSATDVLILTYDSTGSLADASFVSSVVFSR